MDTVQLEATQTARNNRVHDPFNVYIKKNMMKSVHNQAPAKRSSMSYFVSLILY